MDPYQETFQTWNKIAELYEEKFMHLKLYDSTYDLFCSKIKDSNAAILEIGCGPGNITHYLLSKHPSWKVTGIDVAPKMIELAKKNNPTANFIAMDCRAIHQLSDQFNGIISGFCLPYLSATDAEKLIEDAGKLLINGGTIYLSFVEGKTADSNYQTTGAGDRSYFYYHEMEHLKMCLQQNHFHQIETLFVEYENSKNEKEIHTILIAGKTL